MHTLEIDPTVQDIEGEKKGCCGLWSCLERWTPQIRFVMVVKDIVNCFLNIYFLAELPHCCGSEDKTRTGFMGFFTAAALLSALINLLHVLRNCSKINITTVHEYLSSCTGTFLGVYTFISFSLGAIDSFAFALLMVGYIWGFWTLRTTLMEVYKKKGNQCWGWFILISLVVMNLFSIFVIVFAGIYYQAQNKSTFFNTKQYSSDDKSWYVLYNSEQDERLQNCTLSYDLSNTYNSKDGGVVDEYCILKDNPGSDYRGQCCNWYPLGD